ncbi:sulfurtransferase [Leifsonia sp. 21MFCrub1.1]|uniref:sulfurtransferase n=1 Tax=Leifsonia sp. 21MFCrub1.1 TaxID=1798223 RepID=UPI0008928955|nr:sulfurtransferase [Leifsonia sp. 21MFCrub1.1]SEA64189.1 thiosulfate/3-mercaptopyruvate sulfurtransferase [Leifsonia sp. 21MFCrub1.1]
MTSEISPLITAAALDVALGAESLWSGAGRRRSAWRVLDVRWKLGGPPGREEYERGHIPGAVYVDLDTELAGHGEPADGRHPLPTAEAFQEAARRWGLGDGDAVVVYDDASGTSAARAWWLLRHAGVRDVRVLDGGIAAWRDAGMPLEKGPGATPIPGSITVRFGALPTLDGDAAAALAADARGVLLDARAGERFRGEVEPVDPRPGHIPGAVSAPTTDNLGTDGRMLPADALAQRFEGLGIGADTPVGVYCGSGVTAAHEALAMVTAGLPMPALYAGSYSAWSNDPERPVVTGA